MLFVIIFTFFALLQPCFATEVSLKALQQKAQKEALKYKDGVSKIQDQGQKTVGEGRCQPFKQPLGSCLKKKETQTSKDSPLLTDKAPIIFVSASMPLASLKTLAYQAQKHQARLVIRGLVKGSLQATADLAKGIGHPLDIDPKLFQTYSIQKVPVFLVYHQNQSHKDQWNKVHGNVDLLFAMEKVKEESLEGQRTLS